jgi:hypothetical protein
MDNLRSFSHLTDFDTSVSLLVTEATETLQIHLRRFGATHTYRGTVNRLWGADLLAVTSGAMNDAIMQMCCCIRGPERSKRPARLIISQYSLVYKIFI